MILEKAIERKNFYPTRESIKPILLSVSVAMALSACTPPPPIAGGIPAPTQPPVQPVEEVNNEVVLPEGVAGGIPAHIIPSEPSEDDTHSRFKRKNP